MANWIALCIIGVGICLLLVGCSLLPAKVWMTGLGLMGLAAGAERFHDNARLWWGERRRQRTLREISPLAEALIPQLYGDYSPYIIEAAKELSAAKDTSAVPALITTLENCVNEQRPGWREVAEELTKALGLMGDRRALSLLYRLENVRGIGVMPSIRDAIAAIEPPTSLLRPGNIEQLAPTTLLRPAQGGPSEEATLLLRPTDNG